MSEASDTDFSVGEYLQDELEARGWTTRDCAERMGGDPDVDQLTLDLHIAVLHAPDDHAIHDGTMSEETARGLEIALGTSAQTWLNLDREYHRRRAARRSLSIPLAQDGGGRC